MTSSGDMYRYAACGGMDVQLFTMSEIDDSDVTYIREKKGLIDYKSLRKHNERKVAAAREVCAGCPILDWCSSSASEVDRYWMVRGGEEPFRLTRQKVGGGSGKVPTTSNQPYLAFRCPDGHMGDDAIGYRWTAPQKGAEKVRTRYCRTCYNARQNERSARMGA